MLNKLWQDDSGAVLSAEYLILGSVVVLGGVGGLMAMSESVNSEMGEFGKSVRQIRQSYSAPGFNSGVAGNHGSAASNMVDCDMTP